MKSKPPDAVEPCKSKAVDPSDKSRAGSTVVMTTATCSEAFPLRDLPPLSRPSGRKEQKCQTENAIIQSVSN